jgi:hypothetical protein
VAGHAGFVANVLLEPGGTPAGATESPGFGELLFQVGAQAVGGAAGGGAGPGVAPVVGAVVGAGGQGFGGGGGLGKPGGPVRGGAPSPQAAAAGQRLGMALGQGGKGQTFDLGVAGLPPESLSELKGSMARGLVSGEEIRGRKVGDVVAEFLRGFEEARAASGKTPAFDSAAVETAFRERERIPEMPGLHRGPLEAVEELGKAFAEAAAKAGNTPAFDADAAEAAFRELLTPDMLRPGAGVFGRSRSGSTPRGPAEGLAQAPSEQPVVGTSQWPSAQAVSAQARTTVTSWSGRPPPGVPVTPGDSYVGGYVPQGGKEAICPEASAATDVSGSGDVLGDLHVAPEDLATDRGWMKTRFGKQVAVMPAHTLAGVGPAAASPSFAAVDLAAPDSGAGSAFGQTRGKPEQFPVQPPSTDASPPAGRVFPRRSVAPQSAVPPPHVAGAPRVELRPPQGEPEMLPGAARSGFGRPAAPGGTATPQAAAPSPSAPPRRRGRADPAFEAAVGYQVRHDQAVAAQSTLRFLAGSIAEDDATGKAAPKWKTDAVKGALGGAASLGDPGQLDQAVWDSVSVAPGAASNQERTLRLVREEAERRKLQALRAQLREQKGLERRYGQARSRQDAGATARSARQGARSARDEATGTRGWLSRNRDHVNPSTAHNVRAAAAQLNADRKHVDAAARALDAAIRSGDPKKIGQAIEKLGAAEARQQESKEILDLNLRDANEEIALAAGIEPKRVYVDPNSMIPPVPPPPAQPPDLQSAMLIPGPHSAMIPAGEEGRYGPPLPASPGAPPAVGAVTPTGTFPDCGPCTASCEGKCHPPCKEGEACQCVWVEGTVPTVASGTAPPPPPSGSPPTLAPPDTPPGSTAGPGPDSGLGKGGGSFGGRLVPTHPIMPQDSGILFDLTPSNNVVQPVPPRPAPTPQMPGQSGIPEDRLSDDTVIVQLEDGTALYLTKEIVDRALERDLVARALAYALSGGELPPGSDRAQVIADLQRELKRVTYVLSEALWRLAQSPTGDRTARRIADTTLAEFSALADSSRSPEELLVWSAAVSELRFVITRCGRKVADHTEYRYDRRAAANNLAKEYEYSAKIAAEASTGRAISEGAFTDNKETAIREHNARIAALAKALPSDLETVFTPDKANVEDGSRVGLDVGTAIRRNGFCATCHGSLDGRWVNIAAGERRPIPPEQLLALEASNQSVRDLLARVWDDRWEIIKFAGQTALSMIPGVGEVLDIVTLLDPESDWATRGLALGSLFLSALTLGFSPNFGSAGRAAHGLGEVTPLAKTVYVARRASSELDAGHIVYPRLFVHDAPRAGATGNDATLLFLWLTAQTAPFPPRAGQPSCRAAGGQVSRGAGRPVGASGGVRGEIHATRSRRSRQR